MSAKRITNLGSWFKRNSTVIAGWLGACTAAALSLWFIHLGAGKTLDYVGVWILSANFAAAFFSINFAFIGYNLSPYSRLWRRLSWSHWVLVSFLLSMPMLPVIALLLKPDWVWSAAVAVSPWVTFLSTVTYFATGDLIDPRRVLNAEYTSETIDRYCVCLARTVEDDSKRQKAQNSLPAGERPMHMWKYRPYVIEAENEPLWDRLMLVLSVAIDAHDYEIFEEGFDSAVTIFRALHQPKTEVESVNADGLHYIAERRFKSLLALVGRSASDRIFMEAINSRLCSELTSAESLRGFKEKWPMAVMGMLETICQGALVSGKDYDGLKSLNAIHTFTGVAAAEARKVKGDFLAAFSVAGPIQTIKRIGSYAVTGGDVEMLYRCLEALAWLGCGLASNCGEPGHREEEPLKACITSLVQLGREARHKKLQCFWDGCILPPHIHAEEKLGWILKLLVQIPALKGDTGFYLQRTITEAYCRLRGFECRIEHDPSSNPAFWIKDLKNEAGEMVPTRQTMAGREGYNWDIDYSDEAELKEFTLY